MKFKIAFYYKFFIDVVTKKYYSELFWPQTSCSESQNLRALFNSFKILTQPSSFHHENKLKINIFFGGTNCASRWEMSSISVILRHIIKIVSPKCHEQMANTHTPSSNSAISPSVQHDCCVSVEVEQQGVTTHWHADAHFLNGGKMRNYQLSKQDFSESQ